MRQTLLVPVAASWPGGAGRCCWKTCPCWKIWVLPARTSATAPFGAGGSGGHRRRQVRCPTLEELAEPAHRPQPG